LKNKVFVNHVYKSTNDICTSKHLLFDKPICFEQLYCFVNFVRHIKHNNKSKWSQQRIENVLNYLLWVSYNNSMFLRDVKWIWILYSRQKNVSQTKKILEFFFFVAVSCSWQNVCECSFVCFLYFNVDWVVLWRSLKRVILFLLLLWIVITIIALRLQKLCNCITISDRKFSVSVSVSAEISVSVLVSVSVSVYFKLSVSAEISVQNATENRNLKTIFHTTYFPF
jgi:hypothetical protein